MIPFFTRAFNEEEPAFDPDALGEEVVRDFVGEYIETGWRYLRDKDKADLPHPCLPYYAKIEEDTVPEEPDGIASFAREGPIKPPKEFISDYDAHRLSDFQVEPDDMSDQAVVMRANAAKACSSCPGYCCLAFHLPHWPRTREGIDEQIALLRKRLLSVGEITVRADGERREINDETAKLERRNITFGFEDLSTMEFFRDNLETIDAERGIYACKAFDRVARRCSIYDKRPKLCRKFLCSASVIGQVPRFNHLEAEQLIAAGKITLP
jgi:Fe-S-cluster containining protein